MHWYPIPGFPSTRPKPSAPQKLRPESMKADVLFTTPAVVCVWPLGHVFWIPIIVESLLGGRVTGTSRSQQPSCIHGLGWEGAKEPWSAWLCPELFQGEGIRALCITWVLVSCTGTALGDLTSEVCWTCCRKKQTHLSSGRMAAEVRCSKRSSAPSFLWKRKLQPKPIIAQTLKNKVLPSLLSLTIPVRETLCLEAQKQGVRWTPSAPCGHSSLCSQLIYTCSTNSTDSVPGTGQDTQGAHKDPTEYEQGWAEPPDTRIHPLRSRSKWRPGWEGSGRFRAGAPAGLGCSSRVWCLAGAFIRWKGRVEKDWGLQLFFYWGIQLHMDQKDFWMAITQHSLPVSFCSRLITVSKNRFWKQKNPSEVKEEYCERREIISVHVNPPCQLVRPEESLTTFWPRNAKGTLTELPASEQDSLVLRSPTAVVQGQQEDALRAQ